MFSEALAMPRVESKSGARERVPAAPLIVSGARAYALGCTIMVESMVTWRWMRILPIASRVFPCGPWALRLACRWNGEPMLQARIRIDGREYLLRPEHDAETIMGMITAKVQTGGGFVEIVRTPDRAMSVLVSPGMSLSIEVTRVEDPPAASDAELEQTPLPRSWMDASLDVF